MAASAAKGYVDGRALAEIFAWLRPNDMIWNYWVYNYLLGAPPLAFDILYWNQDSIRMAAGLHADMIQVAVENSMRIPGAADGPRHADRPGLHRGPDVRPGR